MKRILTCLFGGLLVCFLASAPVWAQATAQINGTATDQSGAVLPGVEITLAQTETGVARTTITNETGSYLLSNLPTGPYRLEAALPGFRTYIHNNPFKGTNLAYPFPDAMQEFNGDQHLDRSERNALGCGR